MSPQAWFTMGKMLLFTCYMSTVIYSQADTEHHDNTHSWVNGKPHEISVASHIAHCEDYTE